jgi:hypothetical protein
MRLIDDDLPQAVRLVATDVVTGFAGTDLRGRAAGGREAIFTPDPIREGAAFVWAEPFASDGVMEAGPFAAVVWEYHSVHTGPFQGVEATEQPVVIRGTTIVQRKGRQTTFHRYIDWADVFVQLGMAVTSRAVVPQLPSTWSGRAPKVETATTPPAKRPAKKARPAAR